MTKTIAITLLLIGGCYGPNAPPVEPNYPPPSPLGEATCATACVRFRSLGCPEGKPSPGGLALSCDAVCTKAHSLRPAPLRCWSEAASRDDLISCGGVRCVP